MAGVLILMKLRVLAHSLRGKRAALFVLGAFYGLVGGVASALFPLLAGGDLEAGTDVVAAVFAVWALGWIVGSLLTGGGDETLRPEHFALLPVTARALARGMFAASLVGVPAAATLIGFLGVVLLGAGTGPGPALVGVVGLVLELALVIVVSRVVVAALGAVLASRRAQDLGIVLGSLAALAFVPLRFVFDAIGPVLLERRSAALSTVLRVLPSGWAATAVRGAARGEVLTVVAPLLGLALLVGAGLLAWAPLLARRLTVAAVSTGPSRRSRRDAGTRTARSLGPTGAVALRELRLWWRDARRRSLLLTSVVLGIAIPVFSFAGPGGSAAAYAAVWLVAFAAMQAGNLYGIDGGSMWHLLVTPDAVRADVRGRQVAWLAVVAPPGVLAAVAAPLVVGSPGAYPWLAGLVPVLLGAGSGLVVMQSAYLPFAVPDQRGQNPFSGGSAGSGTGCVRGLVAFAYTLLLVPVALPVVAVVLAGTLADLPWLSWLGAPLGVVEGAALAWWWGGLAHRRVAVRGPEILAEVRVPA